MATSGRRGGACCTTPSTSRRAPPQPVACRGHAQQPTHAPRLRRLEDQGRHAVQGTGATGARVRPALPAAAHRLPADHRARSAHRPGAGPAVQADRRPHLGAGHPRRDQRTRSLDWRCSSSPRPSPPPRLSFFDRWWSSRIGEGVIYDLRVKLFDHVQRLPLAFFTRTQTGALISRMNNDVIGAQRAVTGTLGTVVSNIVVLTTTLIAMFVLQWQITLVALVLLPIFIIPAKRVGPEDAGDHPRELRPQRRHEHPDDRAVQRVGRPAGEAVRQLRAARPTAFGDRAGQVRDIGVRGAMYGRTFFIALGLVGAVGTAAVYGIGGNLVINGTIALGTLVAMAAFVTQIYNPLTVADQRPGRHHDGVRVVRPGLRDPRPDQRHHRPTRRRRPHRPDRAHRDRRRLVPLPRGQRRVAGLARGRRRARCPTEAGVPVLKGISATIEPGQLVALVGPVRGRQDHAQLARSRGSTT